MAADQGTGLENIQQLQRALSRAEAELQAAQEREAMLKEKAGRWFVEASEQQLRAHKAEEREKALREAVIEYEHRLGIPSFASLAAQRTEEAGEQQPEMCKHGRPIYAWMCPECRTEETGE